MECLGTRFWVWTAVLMGTFKTIDVMMAIVLMFRVIIVRMIAVRDMRWNKLVNEPRNNLYTNKPCSETNQENPCSRMFCITTLYEVFLWWREHTVQRGEYLKRKARISERSKWEPEDRTGWWKQLTYHHTKTQTQWWSQKRITILDSETLLAGEMSYE